jgi:hypothetical protein
MSDDLGLGTAPTTASSTVPRPRSSLIPSAPYRLSRCRPALLGPEMRATERSGRINLGLEGILVFGAMSAYATAVLTGSPWAGVAVAGLAGEVGPEAEGNRRQRRGRGLDEGLSEEEGEA